MNALKRTAIRLSFYPSLWFNALMCALRIWRRWDWLDDSVLLGVIPSRRDISRLHELGIGAIVNLCEEFAGHEAEMAARGMEQLRLPTPDYCLPGEADLLRGMSFITRHVAAGRKVYLHCKAGRGRSATLAVCYLMASKRIGAAEAFAVLKAVRSHVTRRLDQRHAVLAIEARLQRGISEAVA